GVVDRGRMPLVLPSSGKACGEAHLTVDAPQQEGTKVGRQGPACGCVPPFTYTMPQRFQGLALENRQYRGRGTSSPDISECNAAELWQTGCRRDFSPACAADASL